MFTFRSLVLLWCSTSAAIASPGRRSAYRTAAPFVNNTATTTSPLTTGPITTPETLPTRLPLEVSGLLEELPTTLPVSAYLYPGDDYLTPTDVSASWSSNSTLNATSSSITISNASCTVQIPSASIGWWYPATFSHPMGEFTSSAGNFSQKWSLTLVFSTATFDAPSALETDRLCTKTETTYTDWGVTITNCQSYYHIPTAAATSLIYRNPVTNPLPSGNVISVADVLSWDVDTEDLPSATTTISAAPNMTITETSATPFVHFTAYEVAYSNRTETIQLQSAHAYPYWQDGVEDVATASGPIPNEFLQQIPQTGCDAGQLQATVTVVMVVLLYYRNRPHWDPFIVHFESSALGWDDDLPIVVQDHDSMSPNVMTVGEPSTPSQPAVTGRPQARPDSASATRAPRIDQPDAEQTAGSIGAEPVVVGPTAVVVGTRTLRPGPSVTVAGTPVAMLPSVAALVIGGTTTLLPQADPASFQTVGAIGGRPVVMNPSGGVLVGSQTIRPGEPINIDVEGGVPVSFATDASALVIGTTTSLLPPPVPQFAPLAAVLTIGATTLTPNAQTQYILDPSQTLTPGGTAVVDGTLISLAPGASFVVVGGTTRQLARPTPMPVMVVDGMTFTPLPPGPSGAPTSIARFRVGGETLIAGGPAVTLSSSPSSPGSNKDGNRNGGGIANKGDVDRPMVLSLAPSASLIVIDGSSILLSPPSTPSALPAQDNLTLGALTLTPIATPAPTSGPGTTSASGLRYVIDGQTLTPGGAVTVRGTTVELDAKATEVRWGVGGVWETGRIGAKTTGTGDAKSVQDVEETGSTIATATATSTSTSTSTSAGSGSVVRRSEMEVWIGAGVPLVLAFIF